MNDSHDNGAAGRLAAYLDAWDRCFGQVRSDISRMRVDGELHVLTDHDLRAVLAENETMRKQIAGLKRVWALRIDDVTVAEGTEDFIRETSPPNDHVVSRLVGQWQPADPSPSAPMPACAPTPNALICACGGPVGHDKPSTDTERN